MREGLAGHEWKKIAGEILSSDFLVKCEMALKETTEKLVVVDLQLSVDPSKRESLSSVLNDLVII